MNKRFIVMLLVLLTMILMALSVTINGTKESSDLDVLKFVFMVYDLENPFWATYVKSVSDVAAESGQNSI